MSDNAYKPDADQDPDTKGGGTADEKDMGQSQGQEQDIKSSDSK